MGTKRNPRTRQGRGIKTRNTVDRNVWTGASEWPESLDAPDFIPAGSTVQKRVKKVGPYLAASFFARQGWLW